MSFLGKLFSNKNEIQVFAPIKGKVVKLEDLPDPVFSAGMMGDGLGIEASENIVKAPFEGEVVTLFPTNHAIGLVNSDGVEVLIHVGINTVEMDGEGFIAHVSQGDKVKQGDLLLEFDAELIREKGYASVTPIIITNSANLKSIKKTNQEEIDFADELFVVEK